MNPQHGSDFSLLSAIFGLLAVGLIIFLSIQWGQQRGLAILRRWASDSGYHLVDAEHKMFSTGPFFWRHAKGQRVYRIRVRDEAGHVKTGWARCGGWFMGLWSDKITVEWDDGSDA